MTRVVVGLLFDDHGNVKHYPKMFIVKNSQVLSHQRYLDVEKERILREVRETLLEDQDEGDANTPTPEG